MAFLLLAFIVISLTVSDGAVPTDTKFKEFFNKLVKIPVPVTNTSNNQNLESPSTTPKCNVTITGPWAKGFNFTGKPIPPHVDEIFKVHVDFHALTDVWYITARGNLTRKGAPHGYSFDVNICDYKQKLCPIRKGETRHIDDSVFLPSAYVDKGVYSACTELIDQDDKLILVLDIRDCPVV